MVLGMGCSQVVTKRATTIYVAYLRASSRASGAVLGLALLTACSGGDHLAGVVRHPEVETRRVSATAAPATAEVVLPQGGAVSAYGAGPTGSDGYPNINVDTARRLGGPARSTAEQERLEAELLALGARQKSYDAAVPSSAIGELKELARRSKSDAERLIESGAAPLDP